MAGTQRSRRKAERPGEILEAAFMEFTIRGYEATRLEDVAQRAGVTKGTIYVYFANKEQLFESLLLARGVEQRERLQAFLDQREEPTLDAIRENLILLLETVADDQRCQDLLRLLIAEARRFPKLVEEHFDRVFEPVCAHLKARLRDAADRGFIRAAPVIEYPELLLSPALVMHISNLLFFERPQLDVRSCVRASVDLFVNGLLPGSSGKPKAKSNRRRSKTSSRK